MLHGRDIIMFGSDWNRFPSTVQHIGQVLARKNRVLWVGGLGLRRPRVQFSDVKRIVGKASKMIAQNYTRKDILPVFEYHPFVLPFYDSRPVRKWNDRRLTSALRQKIAELGFSNPILFPSTPVVAGILGNLGESSSHYLCVDDYSHFAGVFKSVPAMESALLERVNSCFSVSDILVRTRVPRHGESHFLPQGVDTAHFRRMDSIIPENLAAIPRPVVGFFGIVASWIDLDLIVRCARAYPRVSFVIVGRSLVDTTTLSGVPNIFLLGEVSYELLPRYASIFDVGIIPFVVNQLTIAANPLKLLEYLALEIPVVSTRLPEVEKFGDAVLLANDSDHFLGLVGVALSNDTEMKRSDRRRIAEKYSWEGITENISAVVEACEQKLTSVQP